MFSPIPPVFDVVPVPSYTEMSKTVFKISSHLTIFILGLGIIKPLCDLRNKTVSREYVLQMYPS